MNKNDLKKVLKPLIKECIKEVLFEEKGALSHIISEVAVGLSGTTKEVVKEVRTNTVNVANEELRRKKMMTKRKKLLDAIGKDAYNGVDLFEGTTPVSAPSTQGQAKGPLSDIDPGDPGVDISNIFGAKAFAITQKLMERK